MSHGGDLLNSLVRVFPDSKRIKDLALLVLKTLPLEGFFMPVF